MDSTYALTEKAPGRIALRIAVRERTPDGGRRHHSDLALAIDRLLTLCNARYFRFLKPVTGHCKGYNAKGELKQESGWYASMELVLQS